MEGRRVMVARAAEARDVLPDALAGARRARWTWSRCTRPWPSRWTTTGRAALEQADYVTFTSSSTVRFLMEAAGRFPDGARLVSIGPVTSATAREHGLEVHVEAERHDIDGLVDALAGGRGPMIVSLLTDYGTDDDFVGTCHGVIASIAPDARIIDVTHGIPRFDVRRGAIALHDALPYLPVGVHVAVVDPQVGTERRGIAVQCHDGNVLVGPDNGLLSLAWRDRRRRGHRRGHHPLAAPAGAGVRHLPRPRRVRPRGRAHRGGRAARGRRHAAGARRRSRWSSRCGPSRTATPWSRACCTWTGSATPP